MSVYRVERKCSCGASMIAEGEFPTWVQGRALEFERTHAACQRPKDLTLTVDRGDLVDVLSSAWSYLHEKTDGTFRGHPATDAFWYVMDRAGVAADEVRS